MEKTRTTVKQEELTFIPVVRSIRPAECVSLETRIFHGDGAKKRHLAILAHPYGPLGGNMDDPLISALFDHFAFQGYSTLRFNFRGIGQSTGSASYTGTGQMEDMRKVLQYVRDRVNIAKDFILLVGYSFGAVAGAAMLEAFPEVKAFVSISYPCGALWLLKLLQSSKCPILPAPSACIIPKLFINGSNDSYSSTRAFHDFTAKFAPPKEAKVLPNWEHTWTGKEAQVVSTISAWMHETRVGEEGGKRKGPLFASPGGPSSSNATPRSRPTPVPMTPASTATATVSTEHTTPPTRAQSHPQQPPPPARPVAPTAMAVAVIRVASMQREAQDQYERERAALFSPSPRKVTEPPIPEEGRPPSGPGSMVALFPGEGDGRPPTARRNPELAKEEEDEEEQLEAEAEDHLTNLSSEYPPSTTSSFTVHEAFRLATYPTSMRGAQPTPAPGAPEAAGMGSEEAWEEVSTPNLPTPLPTKLLDFLTPSFGHAPPMAPLTMHAPTATRAGGPTGVPQAHSHVPAPPDAPHATPSPAISSAEAELQRIRQFASSTGRSSVRRMASEGVALGVARPPPAPGPDPGPGEGTALPLSSNYSLVSLPLPPPPPYAYYPGDARRNSALTLQGGLEGEPEDSGLQRPGSAYESSLQSRSAPFRQSISSIGSSRSGRLVGPRQPPP